MTVIDLFAGMGGWDLGAHELGLDPLGIEWNADACATREAVGLRTLHADISQLDPWTGGFAPCEGLIASPPWRRKRFRDRCAAEVAECDRLEARIRDARGTLL